MSVVHHGRPAGSNDGSALAVRDARVGVHLLVHAGVVQGLLILVVAEHEH